MNAVIDEVIDGVSTLVQRLLSLKTSSGDSYRHSLCVGSAHRLTAEEMRANVDAVLNRELALCVKDVAAIALEIARLSPSGESSLAGLAELEPFHQSVQFHLVDGRRIAVGEMVNAVESETRILIHRYLVQVDEACRCGCDADPGVDAWMHAAAAYATKDLGSLQRAGCRVTKDH